MRARCAASAGGFVSIRHLRPWPTIPERAPKTREPGDPTTWPTREPDLHLIGAGYVPTQAKLGMRRTRVRNILSGDRIHVTAHVGALEHRDRDGRLTHVGPREITRHPAYHPDPNSQRDDRLQAVFIACGFIVGLALAIVIVLAHGAFAS